MYILFDGLNASYIFFYATDVCTKCVVSISEQIIYWRKYLKFPEDSRLSPEARDLMCRLLCDADHRLGARGADEVKVNVGTLEK